MKIIALQSGSAGNAVYVEAGGLRLLIDAGISGLQAELRLAAAGREIRQIDAVLISHDHRDHAGNLGIFQRKFGLPAYVTDDTLAAAGAYRSLGKLGEIRSFRSGDTLELGDLRIETVPTPHDGADGVGFVIDDGRRRLGVLTDLGHVFAALPDVIASLDAVLLESNYDPGLLEAGPYPPFLKQRIRGPGGHLSNQEAATLLRDAAGPRLQWACLGHLSEENNHPRRALETHGQILGDRLPLHLASRHRATDVLTVQQPRPIPC